MSNLRINIAFEDFQGIGEMSTEKVRKIISKPRKHCIVKKIGEGLGCNNVYEGKIIPDRLASICFDLYCTKKHEFKETLSQIIDEIESLGYPFSYEFSPLEILFFDGGIDECVFNDIITMKRDLGYGEIEKSMVPIMDIDTKKMAIVHFSLVCDNRMFIDLLFEILADFDKLDYSFEVRGY